MKKVFFIMSTDDYSGAEAVNFSIINYLKNKYKFYWVSKKGKINSFLEKNKIEFIEIQDLSVKEINRVIKTYEPDILHATDYKASFICSLSKIKNIPLISHLHNNSPWLSKIHPYSFALLFIALKSEIILTVSNSIEKEYIFSKIIRNKIKMIGNPISVNNIVSKVTENDYKKKYDICCVGRLTQQKNPYKFLNIVKKISLTNPDIKCVWVGKGELFDDISDKCKALNIENNIDFVGFQNNPYQYMACSKIFLLCSDWEGFGLVAFEALSLGLPCVVSNVGGLPMMVNESCGKLCDIENEYIEEINKLLTNDDYYKLKSTSAVVQSKSIDNLNDYMKFIDEIYKEY